MTLIEVRSASGAVGRCDAHCYGASKPTCDCVCGGLNHGVGLDAALRNTHEAADTMVREYTLRLGWSDYTHTVTDQIYQGRIGL